MAMARVVWFRQSRWDDRVSLQSSVAVEGGYSTKDSWLLRARGDFPRIADGWRLEGFAEAGRFAQYAPGNRLGEAATREIAGGEVTRALDRHLYLALRGEATHVDMPVDPTVLAITTSSATTETDVRARLAFVYDRRDREYDTRRGALLQGGVLVGSAGTGYHGTYFLAGVWVPLGPATRITGRVGARTMSHSAIDASRIIPAWEDEFVAVGGPESNRALPVGARTDREVELASVEIRHDLFTFPGGAIVLFAFVDGGRASCACDAVSVGSRAHASGPWPSYLLATDATALPSDWVVGPGGGMALRLLRNAVLTATVARAENATRIYVSSGWSW